MSKYSCLDAYFLCEYKGLHMNHRPYRIHVCIGNPLQSISFSCGVFFAWPLRILLNVKFIVVLNMKCLKSFTTFSFCLLYCTHQSFMLLNVFRPYI
jgi:hypothetical protein